jgi:hypothetical protein
MQHLDVLELSNVDRLLSLEQDLLLTMTFPKLGLLKLKDGVENLHTFSVCFEWRASTRVHLVNSDRFTSPLSSSNAVWILRPSRPCTRSQSTGGARA